MKTHKISHKQLNADIADEISNAFDGEVAQDRRFTKRHSVAAGLLMWMQLSDAERLAWVRKVEDAEAKGSASMVELIQAAIRRSEGSGEVESVGHQGKPSGSVLPEKTRLNAKDKGSSRRSRG